MFAAIKGWFGEKAAQLGMWLGLDGKVYRRFHDLVIPCQGGTAQIDHILVSVYGVFVIETKNMNGWIFGERTIVAMDAEHLREKIPIPKSLAPELSAQQSPG